MITTPRSRPFVLLAAAWALSSADAPPARAQSAIFPDRPDSAFAAVLSGIEGEPLTLEDAVAQALGQATDIGEARAELLAAEGAAHRERGAFDPVLFADLELRGADVPAASPFAGADVLETREQSSAAGARWRLPIGTEFEATLETTRLETNSSFAALDPEYSTQGRLEIRQPLLKGFGLAASAGRTSAVHELQAARARLSDAGRAVEADVTVTYWNLYAAERNLAVQRLIVERAQVFLEEAGKRADAGLAGPSEVAIARAFLTEQQLAELDREEYHEEVSDRLSSLLGHGPSHPTGRFHPTTVPTSDYELEDEDVLLDRALEQNDELRAARRDLEATQVRAGAARWNALPTLDLLGSVGGNGLTGTGQPVTFGDATILVETGDGYAESIREALKRDFPTWSVGLTLEVPLGSREGRGERDRLRGEVAGAEQRVVALERSVREEVRARSRELRHGLRRLDLARTGVNASMEQVRIGQIEYQNGRSTAFELVRLGADLASAQERYSAALVRTAQAAAELRRLAPGGDAPSPQEES